MIDFRGIAAFGRMILPAASFLCFASAAHAAEPQSDSDLALSATIGASYNSHYVSYGSDVWAGGNNFFGDRSIVIFTGNFEAKYQGFTADLGVRANLNDQALSVFGDTEEIDTYIGGSYSMSGVKLGVRYEQWHYLHDTEDSIDTTVVFDDSLLFGTSFHLYPGILWHARIKGNHAISQSTGSAVLAGIAPGWTLTDDGMYFSIPISVAFFLTDNFKFGNKTGYAYSFFGVNLDVPLNFIPGDRGTWFNVYVTHYRTEPGAIPFNVEPNFTTAGIGLRHTFN